MKDNVYLQYVVDYFFSNAMVKNFKKVGLDAMNIFKPCFRCNLDPFLLNHYSNSVFLSIIFFIFRWGLCVWRAQYLIIKMEYLEGKAQIKLSSAN